MTSELFLANFRRQKKVSWHEFADKYFDSDWFHAPGRPNTLAAMRHFHKKVPASALRKLSDELKILVFAPMPARGRVIPITMLTNTVLIYLSPELESYSQRRINLSVAHEFAHVFLGNYEPGHPDQTVPKGWSGKYRDQPDEKAVHKLLEKWGLERPRRKKKPR